MSREDYPLYMKWRRTICYLLDLCSKFPKTFRFNLSDRITNTSLDVMEDIVHAIYAKEKITNLDQANLSIEKLRVLIHISLDLKIISLSQYAHIAKEMQEVGRMIGGWRKQCKE